MSNFNVLLCRRITKVLNRDEGPFKWETDNRKDILIGAWLAHEDTDTWGNMELPLNYFLTQYKSWIRDPVEATKPLHCVSSCQEYMEILRHDFLVNGWDY
jgi:hypothetical protein